MLLEGLVLGKRHSPGRARWRRRRKECCVLCEVVWERKRNESDERVDDDARRSTAHNPLSWWEHPDLCRRACGAKLQPCPLSVLLPGRTRCSLLLHLRSRTKCKEMKMAALRFRIQACVLSWSSGAKRARHPNARLSPSQPALQPRTRTCTFSGMRLQGRGFSLRRQ